MEDKIDIVITWVDGNDERWRREKEAYTQLKGQGTDDRARRYRDWDNLQYLFRGIEKFAPWVNRIFLVTAGHYPSWISRDHPKLKLVEHSDFIPKEFLPTFNAGTIELFLHRIPELQERFVYFNDDMFLIGPVKKTSFFRGGLPCDTAAMSAIKADYMPDGVSPFGFCAMCTRLVALKYSKRDILKKFGYKFFDPRNGRDLIKTIFMLPWDEITGFNNPHMPYSFLKSVFHEIWEFDREDLLKTCQSRFRTDFWIGSWGVRYWQLCSGRFAVRSPRLGKFFDLRRTGDEMGLCKLIRKQKRKIVCINDNIEDDRAFESIKDRVNQAFQAILPDRCGFERNFSQ